MSWDGIKPMFSSAQHPSGVHSPSRQKTVQCRTLCLLPLCVVSPSTQSNCRVSVTTLPSFWWENDGQVTQAPLFHGELAGKSRQLGPESASVLHTFTLNLWFLKTFKMLFVVYFCNAYMHVHTCIHVHFNTCSSTVWRSEDNLMESVSSLPLPCGPRDQVELGASDSATRGFVRWTFSPDPLMILMVKVDRY